MPDSWTTMSGWRIWDTCAGATARRCAATRLPLVVDFLLGKSARLGPADLNGTEQPLMSLASRLLQIPMLPLLPVATAIGLAFWLFGIIAATVAIAVVLLLALVLLQAA